MTAQIHDIFQYRGDDYAVVGMTEGELFDVSALGVTPEANCTFCYRGYQATYSLNRSRLTVDALSAGLPKGDRNKVAQSGPIIRGITPTGPLGEWDPFNKHYLGLDYPLDYSGGLLLAKNYIEKMNGQLVFYSALKYKTVIELVFEAGVLREEQDRSDRIAEIRKTIRRLSRAKNSPNATAIEEFMKAAFGQRHWFN